MKLNKIAKLCKQTGYLLLIDAMNEDGTIQQFASDGFNALYPIQGMPHMNTDEIMTVFDFSSKAKDKIISQLQSLEFSSSNVYNFKDLDPSETLADMSAISFTWNDMTLCPTYTAEGLFFFEKKYLEPLSDVIADIELYSRVDRNGNLYFVAKLGMLLQAVIIPYRFRSKGPLEELRNIAKLAKGEYLFQQSGEDPEEEFISEGMAKIDIIVGEDE